MIPKKIWKACKNVENRPKRCVKSVCIRSFPGPYFHASALNTRRISPYSVRMRENTDHKNSEYGHFLRSVKNEVISCQKVFCKKARNGLYQSPFFHKATSLQAATSLKNLQDRCFLVIFSKHIEQVLCRIKKCKRHERLKKQFRLGKQLLNN